MSEPLPRSVAAAAASSRSSLGGAAPGPVEQIDRFVAGDREAFDELVRLHRLDAHAHALRLLGNGVDADDAVQEAFLRVLRHRRRFDRARPFRSWLLAIVRNLAIDMIRGRRPTRRHVALIDRGAADAPLDGGDLRSRVVAVLDELPKKYRAILVMRELEGMPAEDVAAEIGVDYGTTRWRLFEARRLFRAAWIARFGHDG